MTRPLIPLAITDISGFAKSLRLALQAHPAAIPSHLELLNMLAKAAGFQNFQTLQAQASNHASPASFAADGLEKARTISKLRPPSSTRYPDLSEAVRKVLSLYDERQRLLKLPAKYSMQQLVMWHFWAQFERGVHYTEKAVNEILKAHHTFGDHATLRRELINMKLLARTADCADYWKLEAKPTEDAQALIDTLAQLKTASL